MGELGALFNPGMRHELEERQAKAARREEEGNAKDGDLRIDLESGVAVINAPGGDDDTETAPAESDDEGSAAAAGDGKDSGPTPAASSTQNDPDNESVSRDVSVRPALRPRGKRGLSASSR